MPAYVPPQKRGSAGGESAAPGDDDRRGDRGGYPSDRDRRGDQDRLACREPEDRSGGRFESLREDGPSRSGKGGGKGDGKGGGDPSQEASLRVTNLSDDVREGDLQDLFSQCGRLQRVYLAKDQATMQSRGFAFITYYTREDAQKAIDKLNGHGYDNLILQVQFAKPRT
mmetsp:Transcript_27159/g.75718  ORF Transcript_27159/g.75718 Transcript_27159/m.75718 type:complete len:169 (+) Transcript_27159:72-578(+)